MMKISAALLALALASSSLCVQGQTVLEVVEDSANHTTLAAAVDAAPNAISDFLDDDSASFTLFAPDNSAFATLPNGTVGLLTSEPWQNHLVCVLLGHVYGDAAVNSSSITDPISVESEEDGFFLNLTRSGDTVSVNGIPVTTPDIPASNGIIHSISAGVLLPDCVAKNIADVLTESGNFTTLLAVVNAGNLTGLVTAPPTPEGLTVLAPNDEAFAAVPPEVTNYLLGNTTALRDVLSYHVIESNFIPTEDETVESALGEDLEFTVDDDEITVNGNTLVEVTTLASNGIVHEIDAVLLPPNFALPTQASEMPSAAPSSLATGTSETPSQAPTVEGATTSQEPTGEVSSEAPSQAPSVQASTGMPSLTPTETATISVAPTSTPGPTAMATSASPTSTPGPTVTVTTSSASPTSTPGPTVMSTGAGSPMPTATVTSSMPSITPTTSGATKASVFAALVAGIVTLFL